MKWWAITCGIVGGGIPFLLGTCLVGEQLVYKAIHPTPPGMGACGNPMVVAIALMALGTPLGAGVFALVGWLLSGCVAFYKNNRVEPPEEVAAAAAVEHRLDNNPYRSPLSAPERKERPVKEIPDLTSEQYKKLAIVLLEIVVTLAILGGVMSLAIIS
ncbi:MAG: hypothetical protein SGJ19_02415 [Planctomycetia bacterium]|nr:hypothetical protein [Planctomycetia bacterium]